MYNTVCGKCRNPLRVRPTCLLHGKGVNVMDWCYRRGHATEKKTPPSGNGIIGGCGRHQTEVAAPWLDRPPVSRLRQRQVEGDGGCSVNKRSYGANARAVPVTKRTYRRK